MGLGEKLTKGSIGGGVNIAKHGNMAKSGVEALQSAKYSEEEALTKMPGDETQMDTDRPSEDPSIAPKMSGSYSGKFMEQPLRYGMTNESPATKLVKGQKELIKKAPELAKAIDESTGGGGIKKSKQHYKK